MPMLPLQVFAGWCAGHRRLGTLLPYRILDAAARGDEYPPVRTGSSLSVHVPQVPSAGKTGLPRSLFRYRPGRRRIAFAPGQRSVPWQRAPLRSGRHPENRPEEKQARLRLPPSPAARHFPPLPNGAFPLAGFGEYELSLPSPCVTIPTSRGQRGSRKPLTNPRPCRIKSLLQKRFPCFKSKKNAREKRFLRWGGSRTLMAGC